MADSPVVGYADALFSVAEAEGNISAVEDELFGFSQTLQTNEDLRSTLSDPEIPVSKRLQIIEDLLDGKASSTTTSLLTMVVSAGRAGDLPSIINAFVERSANSRNKAVATVRSAIDLTQEQHQRLTEAIKTSTGKDVEVKVVIDPSVLGGAITEIGDDIIDGSVRRRLNQLRESFR